MVLKADIIYRKAVKEDYPAVIDFIRKSNQSIWECENDNTPKKLSKMLFYKYMVMKKSFWVAVYRNQVVGVILTGNEKKKRQFSRYGIKGFLALKKVRMTKEGRLNLKNMEKVTEMQKEVAAGQNIAEMTQILLFYVSKNFGRNGIGTGLLKHVLEEEEGGLIVYANQKSNNNFLEKHDFVKVSQTTQMMDINKQRFRQSVVLYKCEKRDK